MVSSKNVQSFEKAAMRHRWQLSTMIKNVQELIDRSKHGPTLSNDLSKNFVDRKGGHKYFTYELVAKKYYVHFTHFINKKILLQ